MFASKSVLMLSFCFRFISSRKRTYSPLSFSPKLHQLGRTSFFFNRIKLSRKYLLCHYIHQHYHANSDQMTILPLKILNPLNWNHGFESDHHHHLVAWAKLVIEKDKMGNVEKRGKSEWTSTKIYLMGEWKKEHRWGRGFKIWGIKVWFYL